MELPEHYFPIHKCPHSDMRGNQRLSFADQGAFHNVNFSIKDQHVTPWPHRATGKVQGLQDCLPSLPLYDYPLVDKWQVRDQILGVHNYYEVIGSFSQIHGLLNSLSKFCLKIKNPDLKKRFKKCKDIVRRLSQLQRRRGPHDPLEEKTIKEIQVLKENLQKSLQLVVEKYEDVHQAHNENCIAGFNRDFYGGLLSTETNTDGTSETLYHAGGNQFKNIYKTEVAEFNGLKSVAWHQRLSVQEPVFQLSSSSKQRDNALLCARQKHQCLLLRDNGSNEPVTHRGCLDLGRDEILSSVTFSQYLNNELLVSTNSGNVYLWDLNASHRKLLEKAPRFESRVPWSCCYYGGHPRHIVVADNSSVEMFDHRSNFSDGIELFSLSRHLIKQNERVMLAANIGFPFHAVATDYGLFVMDQRFASTPVLQWSPEFISPAQYIQVLQYDKNSDNKKNFLFLASQQPAEVMCFSMDISSGKVPTSPILPWRISRTKEFCQSSLPSYICDLSKAEKRFETSLAGMAVSSHPSNQDFTVYQLDAYGDLFYQTLRPEGNEARQQRKQSFKLKCSSMTERDHAKDRADKWLKGFDDLVKQSLMTMTEKELEYEEIKIAPGFLSDVFTYKSSQSDKMVEKQIPRKKPKASNKHILPLHSNLLAFDRMQSRGSNTKVLLALKNNEDLKGILEQREADHRVKREKLRARTLSELKKPYKSRAILPDFETDSSENEESPTKETKITNLDNSEEWKSQKKSQESELDREDGNNLSKSSVAVSDDSIAASDEITQDSHVDRSGKTKREARKPDNFTPYIGLPYTLTKKSASQRSSGTSIELTSNASRPESRTMHPSLDKTQKSVEESSDSETSFASPKKNKSEPSFKLPMSKKIVRERPSLPRYVKTHKKQILENSLSSLSDTSSTSSRQFSIIDNSLNVSQQSSIRTSPINDNETKEPARKRRTHLSVSNRNDLEKSVTETSRLGTQSKYLDEENEDISKTQCVPAKTDSQASASKKLGAGAEKVGGNANSKQPGQDAGTNTAAPQSLSLFSSVGDSSEAKKDLSWNVGNFQAPSTSSCVRSPHSNVLSWLLNTETQSSEADSPTLYSPIYPVMEPQEDKLQQTTARRKLPFDSLKPDTHQVTLKKAGNRERVEDSVSESEDEEFDENESQCSSVLSSRKRLIMSNPRMRRLVEPSLAGFLQSPLRPRKRKMDRKSLTQSDSESSSKRSVSASPSTGRQHSKKQTKSPSKSLDGDVTFRVPQSISLRGKKVQES